MVAVLGAAVKVVVAMEVAVRVAVEMAAAGSEEVVWAAVAMEVAATAEAMAVDNGGGGDGGGGVHDDLVHTRNVVATGVAAASAHLGSIAKRMPCAAHSWDARSR